MHMNVRRVPLGCLFVLFCAAPLLHAQRVQGTVVGANEQPVAGVVLLLIDQRATVAAKALSNEKGEFRLAAPAPGAYRLRTLRIGFAPVTSEVFLLEAGQLRNERIHLANIPYTLEPTQVNARSVCPRTSPESLAVVFAAWEQVRTALYAAELTTREGALDATTLRYTRLLDRNLENVLAQKNDFSTSAVHDPWQPVHADTLHARGYVRTGDDDSVTYAAPSLDALVSDAFFADHCFTLSAGPEDQRRIVFEPTSDRRRIPEVRGLVILDRASSELRRVEYSYVNLPAVQMKQAGGVVDFTRLRSGEWVIPQWSVRMPVVGAFAGFRGDLRMTRVKVEGGQLIAAVRDGDTLWRHPLLALSGRVVDSATGAPVADARVTLAGTRLEGATQHDGSFRISGVLPGEYTAHVRGPGQTYAGMVVAIPVTFTDSALRIALKIPTAAQAAGSICGKDRMVAAVSSDAMVTGHVDATLLPDGQPRAIVTAEWLDLHTWFDPASRRFVTDSRPVSSTVTVDERGEFRICFIPAATRVTLHAAVGDVRAQQKTISVPREQHFARVELVLDSNLEPVTTLIGVVRSDSADHPLAGLEVILPDLGLFSMTDDRGLVRISEIPLGTHRVQVRCGTSVEHDTVVVFQRTRITDIRVTLHHGKNVAAHASSLETSGRAILDANTQCHQRWRPATATTPTAHE